MHTDLNQPVTVKVRSFLKWAGNKQRLLPRILPFFEDTPRLVEPFVGSATVFLNTAYKTYLLNDCNPDLIQLYRILQQKGDNFIDQAAPYFKPEFNCAEAYYRLRQEFNECRVPEKRAALFLYLNRHGFNGLCRYNQKHVFNVPFGRYINPYFPTHEMQIFHKKAQQAEFVCLDFKEVFKTITAQDTVYCDPPYVPLSLSANFTQYSGNLFGENDQRILAEQAHILSKAHDISIIVSNHDTTFTRELYKEAKAIYFPVRRLISSKGDQRGAVMEVLAIFK